MTRLFALAALVVSSASIVTAKSAAQPCAQVRNSLNRGDDIPASLAYECLTSVPFSADVGIAAVENFKKVSEFHSTLGDLKNPGKGYANPAVDIIDLLDKAIVKINDGGFKNQYQFEEEMASIVGQSFDGHYSFMGNTFMGALRWFRGAASRNGYEGSLISASLDGSSLPQVYFTTDLANADASPIVKMDGEAILSYMEKEMSHQSFHDPDARWNTLFARQQSDSPGAFVSPWFYPGSNFTATFANGSTKTVKNYALIPRSFEDQWSQVVDGKTFYEQFVSVDSGTSSKLKKRELKKRDLPPNYPDPVIEHSDSGIELGAFFLDGTGLGEIAVLSMNTFMSEERAEGLEFQLLVEDFIKYAKKQGKKKLIIDLSSNGGGSLFLGYDVFKQFFPSLEPDIGTRMRSSKELEILGSEIGTVTLEDAQTGEVNGVVFPASRLYLSSFHWSGSLDSKLEPFTSWDEMNGPVTINGAEYTELMRYNFSDAHLYLGDVVGSISGYGDRADLTEQPFDADDILLLHDGYCASTCAVFTDLMRRQGGVKSYVLGGRPQFGPMQSVGGTKGALLLQWETLGAYIGAVLGYFGSASDEKKWAAVLPTDFGMAFASPPSVNFRSGYHPDSDTPMQFLNETAQCRLWYTPAMLNNVTHIWDTVARLAWGIEGGTGQACVHGSVGDGKVVGETTATGGSASATAGGKAAETGKADDDSAATMGRVSWAGMGALGVLSAVVLGL